jgi:hypothetical protein
MTRTEYASRLEDEFSIELEETGFVKALNIDDKGLKALARNKYQSDNAAATGGALCDLIEEFIDSIQWQPIDFDPAEYRGNDYGND